MRPEPKKICAVTQGMLLLLNWRSWRLPNRAYSLTSQGYHSNQRPLSDQAINIRKNHVLRTIRKLALRPKMAPLKKKRSLRKKTRANRRTRRRQMPTDRRLRAVRKLPAHPQVTVGARAKNRFRKHIGITGTLFLGKRKRRSDNESMDGIAVSQ